LKTMTFLHFIKSSIVLNALENKEFILETQIRKTRKFSCTEHLLKWRRHYIS
jgi:hypothetical protein